MISIPDHLLDDPAALKQLIAQMQSKVAHLEEQNALLRQRLFGRKSEQTVDPATPQLALFNDWRIHRSAAYDLGAFSRRYNAVIRGWIEYYGKFWYRNFSYRLWSALQSRFLKWMKSKYRISTRQAEHRLRLVRKGNPELFAHWYLLRASNV